ncbi:MAG: hypothetical protein ACRDAL_02445 [Plesiomonas shigelloides]
MIEVNVDSNVALAWLVKRLTSWPADLKRDFFDNPWSDEVLSEIGMITTNGWKWRKLAFGYPVFTDGNTIITRDMWMIAKVKVEIKNNPPRIMSEEEFAAEHAATAIQASPSGSGNPILGMVLADLTNRALEGKDKYGEPLKANNGRKPLWDAYQEALDLCMYLRQMIEEQKQ